MRLLENMTHPYGQYGGAVLQRFGFVKVCMGQNSFEIICEFMYIMKINSTYLNVLLSFLL